MYTFDSNIVSDLHKDARGFRPTEYFWEEWDQCGDDTRQAMWDSLCKELEDAMEADRIAEQAAIAEFEREVELTISAGAKDRNTALRWMTQNALFRDAQDIEHWVWERGILFTDLGRATVKDLKNIVEVQ